MTEKQLNNLERFIEEVERRTREIRRIIYHMRRAKQEEKNIRK